MPKTRQKITVFLGKVSVGTFQAPFHIKPLGVNGCKYCPALDDGPHTSACAQNKADKLRFIERAKKKKAMMVQQANGGLGRKVLQRLDLEPGELV